MCVCVCVSLYVCERVPWYCVCVCVCVRESVILHYFCPCAPLLFASPTMCPCACVCVTHFPLSLSPQVTMILRCPAHTHTHTHTHARTHTHTHTHMQDGITALDMARSNGRDACVRYIEQVVQGWRSRVAFPVHAHIDERVHVGAMMVRMRVT